MATTRRSARLQSRPAQEPANDKLNSPASPAARKREKSKPSGAGPVADTAATLDVVERGKVSRGGKAAASKDKPPNIPSQLSLVKGQARISSLPPEVISIILDNVITPSTISALGRTNKAFYSLMMPRLYGRISVAAMFHAHIPQLIRTLEPHLTIQQKKMLKKEGKYKGQQERFPTRLDEKAKPMCANYVRQLVVGVADPGKKHKYIVERYIEEALKNMENLEIVETRVLTKLVLLFGNQLPHLHLVGNVQVNFANTHRRSISQSLASLSNLKALRIFTNGADYEEIRPLTRIKNLKHLDVQDYANWLGFSDQPHIIQPLIQNSRSTLLSLSCQGGAASWIFLKDWEKNLKVSAGSNIAGSDGQGHGLTALKSLTMSHLHIEEKFIKEFHDVIDFTSLRDLTLDDFKDNECLFYPSLTSLAISHRSTTGAPISLRTLKLNMSEYDYLHNDHRKKALLEAKCRFISSFDTLTTLELPDYGQYPSNDNSTASTNPGLSDTLLQAILKHKNLRVLKISYMGKTGDLEIPYLGAETVGMIVDGLHQLEEFEFAPDELQMDEISQALLRGGSHLKSIKCFPFASWANSSRPDEPGVNIISSILTAFLSNTNINLVSPSSTRPFLWESYYNLNQISVGYRAWEIASDFRKRKEKSSVRQVKVMANEVDGIREVRYRMITAKRHIHLGYDPEFGWVSKVEREMQ